MKFSNNAMSAILLCSYIGIKKEDLVKPLSLGEWNRFLDRMLEFHCEPSIILSQDITVLKKMQFTDDDINRIQILAQRGGAVAFELDDLAKKGIEVVTLFDSDYPVLLKRKLKRKSPPVLFYAGDINLAKKIGIAVVGSRNVDQAGTEFTRKLVEKAAGERLVIYSGGARGVDKISESTAIYSGSAVVSYIADSLISKIKKKDVLDSVMRGKLLLLSDVKPDVGFSSARAMNRNKYIYASAYGAFVVASEYNRGGTWTGAMETIRNQWTKVFVWNHKEYNGNMELIDKGGIAYDLSLEKLYDIMTQKEEKFAQMDMFNLRRPALVNEEIAAYGNEKEKK